MSFERKLLKILNFHVAHILSKKIIEEILIENEFSCVPYPFKENIIEILIKHTLLCVKNHWKEIY